jgi:hypothetical protein
MIRADLYLPPMGEERVSAEGASGYLPRATNQPLRNP